MKKNVATMMAATMTMASVMPVFANEEVKTVVEVDVRTANGQTLVVKTNTITEENDQGVEVPVEIKTIEVEELDKADQDNITAIATAKYNMDNIVAELEKMSEETVEVIEDGQVVTKNKYEIKIDEDNTIRKYKVENGIAVDNKVAVEVKNTQTEEIVGNYEFKGIERLDFDADFGQDVPVVPVTIDLADTAQYADMTRVQFELEKHADKLNVKTEKVSEGLGYKLVLEVTLKDGVKVAEITLENVQSLDEEVYVSLPVNGDVAGHWAEETVLTAMFDKWVDSSATFRPEDSITRAEFVKIVNRAFEIDGTDMSLVSPFEDVEFGQWYFNDVKTAVQAGYIDGYEDGTFKPEQPITRQEAAKIIAKLHKGSDVETVVEINDQEIHKDIVTTFADDADIFDWADESVQYLANNDISNGYEGNVFKPQNEIKRAEALVMMARAAK